MVLCLFISFEWFFGLLCRNLSELEYIWDMIMFFLAEKRNCRKNSCFWKLRWLISFKMSTTYLCVIYFLSQWFFSPHTSDPFHSSLRISFHWWYTIKLKEVVDFWFVHPDDAQLSGIFLPNSTDTKLLYKLMGTQLSLFTTFNVFLFQFIMFCLPDMSACAIL